MSRHIDSLVVYGDSYSSTESTTKSTNGPLWNEQLAKRWDTQLVSLAQPGATFCRNNKKNGSWLKKQMDTYNLNQEEETVHAIFLGVTDLVETKGTAKDVNKWIQCIEDQVTFLCSSNPNTKIIIMGVPALEFSPYALTHTDSSVGLDLKQNIFDFNVALEEKVTDWQETYENVQFFDTYLVFSELFGDSTEAKIENVEEAYWDTCQGKCNEKIDSYLWWDSIHVTGAGHQSISNTIASRQFFDIKPISQSSSSLDSLDDMTGLSNDYVRFLSWILLGCILMMVVYMFRHNRAIVYLKKKIQTKASKLSSTNNRNNHEYALV